MEWIAASPHLLTLSLIAGVSLGAISYWLVWIFMAIGDEFGDFDHRQVGLLVIMLPVARRLGNYSELIRFMPLRNYEIWAKSKLAVSGLSNVFTSREYVGSHLCLFLLGSCLPYFLLLFPNSNLAHVFIVSIVIGTLLFFVPFLVLNNIIQNRKKSIFISFPYFLDLVTLLVESGMDFGDAMESAARQLGKGPLQQEISQFAKETHLGQSRRKALHGLADRCGLPQVGTFATALIQQERLGAPIERTLRTQSDLMRTQRIEIAEELANKAPVKILLPMIVFIFPSIFLILIGPMIIQATQGLR